MAPIQTFVFIDLETTGIPCEELNKTRITEISMLVVKRNHMLETTIGQLPRVQHKLTMCFNPRRPIQPGASAASGLDNDLLEFESGFSVDVFNTIKSFLACQEKPLCLVAENGHTFDFPILKNHFEKLNVSLDEDVMCADSLHAFFDILKMSYSRSATKYVPSEITEEINGSVANEDHNGLSHNKISNNNDVLDCSFIDNGPAIPDETLIKPEKSILSMKAQNENTPKSKMFKMTPKRVKRSSEKTFYDKNPKPTQSYKLKDIYERVLNRPAIEAHRAENDCEMTATIATAKAKEFVQWIDNNYCAFSEIKAMTLGTPLGY